MTPPVISPEVAVGIRDLVGKALSLCGGEFCIGITSPSLLEGRHRTSGSCGQSSLRLVK